MHILEEEDKTRRIIYLAKERCLHILHEHPELSVYFYEFANVLKFPTKIVLAGYDNNIAYYYKYYKEIRTPEKFLLLVVKYLNGKGFIITAYFTKI